MRQITMTMDINGAFLQHFDSYGFCGLRGGGGVDIINGYKIYLLNVFSLDSIMFVCHEDIKIYLMLRINMT